MHSVDDDLRPVSAKTALEQLSRYSFICHHCERVFAARSDELYYFVENDFTYHRHGNAFFRALEILEDGAVRISSLDSVEENVLQIYRMDGSDAAGEADHVDWRQEMTESSRRFFESMKRQKRPIVTSNTSTGLL